jgi:hypothetical protein
MIASVAPGSENQAELVDVSCSICKIDADAGQKRLSFSFRGTCARKRNCEIPEIVHYLSNYTTQSDWPGAIVLHRVLLRPLSDEME